MRLIIEITAHTCTTVAITNAVLSVVCRACSGCWDWLEPVPTGAFAERFFCCAEPKKGPARKATRFEWSFWWGVRNAASSVKNKERLSWKQRFLLLQYNNTSPDTAASLRLLDDCGSSCCAASTSSDDERSGGYMSPPPSPPPLSPSPSQPSPSLPPSFAAAAPHGIFLSSQAWY